MQVWESEMSGKCRMMRENTVFESKGKEVQSGEEGKKVVEILYHVNVPH